MWGPPGECGEGCAGPVHVLCSPTIEPGGGTVISLQDAPADARSAAVFSFSTETVTWDDAFAICDPIADLMCETLFHGVLGDCADYAAFKRAYERGQRFAGIPMDIARGSPLVVRVRRECDGPDAGGLPVAAGYGSLWGPALGHTLQPGADLLHPLPVVHDSDHGRSVVHVQNAGHECAEVTLWVAAEGDCGGFDRCDAFALAPGEARIVDAGDPEDALAEAGGDVARAAAEVEQVRALRQRGEQQPVEDPDERAGEGRPPPAGVAAGEGVVRRAYTRNSPESEKGVPSTVMRPPWRMSQIMSQWLALTFLAPVFG